MPCPMTVTNVLGETRNVTTTWPSGDYACPFCASPTPGPCANPACPANPACSPAQAQAWADMRAKRESEDRGYRRMAEIRANPTGHVRHPIDQCGRCMYDVCSMAKGVRKYAETETWSAHSPLGCDKGKRHIVVTHKPSGCGATWVRYDKGVNVPQAADALLALLPEDPDQCEKPGKPYLDRVRDALLSVGLKPGVGKALVPSLPLKGNAP